MPKYWWLNVEVRRRDGWRIPAEFPTKVERFGYQIGGEFGWMKNNWIASRLFFGGDAIFPFARGRPPGESEFCRLRDEGWLDWIKDMDEVGDAVCWIDYERLYVDLWDEPAVLIHSVAPARLAMHFGKGTVTHSEAALRAAGATDGDLIAMRASADLASNTTDWVDRWSSTAKKMPPGDSVDVTWQASVNWLLADRAEAFRGLRRIGDDADLRVIALLG